MSYDNEDESNKYNPNSAINKNSNLDNSNNSRINTSIKNIISNSPNEILNNQASSLKNNTNDIDNNSNKNIHTVLANKTPKDQAGGINYGKNKNSLDDADLDNLN